MINYHEFSNELNDFVPAEETVEVETDENSALDFAEAVSDELAEAEETEDINDSLVEAKVGKSRCYLRAEPSKDSQDLAILEPGDELLIDMSKSNDEWFNVCTASGKEGYVMLYLVVIS